MSRKIAINGFGRIGRQVFRILEGQSDLEVVAINDLTDPSMLAHLLKYDSVHGRFDANVQVTEGGISVNGRQIAVSAERDPSKLAYVTQTTLSVDDTSDVVTALQKRFPEIVGPHKEDICYATTNRQSAVKEVAPHVEALLVVGAPNSSNSKRLVEVACKAGCPYAQLIQRASEIDWRALEGVKAIGITAGASAPDVLITEVIDAFKARFDTTIKTVETAQENVNFKVPRILREPA